MERTHTDAEKVLEELVKKIDYFINSTSKLDPTEYASYTLRVVEEAKRKGLTFSNKDFINGLQGVITEMGDIKDDKKFDKYENAHFGYVIDWDDYTKREKIVNEKVKKILEGIKREIYEACPTIAINREQATWDRADWYDWRHSVGSVDDM